VRCIEPDGSAADYRTLSYGIFVSKECDDLMARSGNAGMLERALSDSLVRGLSCLTHQGGSGKKLALELGAIIQRSTRVPHRGSLVLTGPDVMPQFNRPHIADDCTEPKPFRVRCKADPCGTQLAIGSLPGMSTYPSLTINTAKLDKLSRNGGEQLPNVLFHEMLHNTGIVHGSSTDDCFAAQSCCFSESVVRPEFKKYAKPAGCAILQDSSRRITNVDYLKDLSNVIGSQDKPYVWTQIAVDSLFHGVSPSQRMTEWPPVLALLADHEITNGSPEFGRRLAEYELSILPANSPLLPKFHELITNARVAALVRQPPIGPEEKYAAQAAAYGLILAQQGNGRALADFVTNPAYAATYDWVREYHGRRFKPAAALSYLLAAPSDFQDVPQDKEAAVRKFGEDIVKKSGPACK
jgi:hypothetical protein